MIARRPYRGGMVALGAACILSGCVPPANAHVAPSPRVVAEENATVDREVADQLEKPIDYDAWKPMRGGATYLAPKDSIVEDDGAVDVVVHFHAGQMADKEWRHSGVKAVIVSATYGQGAQAYKDAFADPNRFDLVLKDVLDRVHATRVRHLALVSWSAGYGATATILREARYYAMVDTVVLLDGLHADYTKTREVDPKALGALLRFATDAADGKKTMVITHSSIVPPGYASTTETAAAICTALDVERIEEPQKNARGMNERYHADRGNLHIRGYRGGEAKDHMDQLALIGDIAHDHIAVPWTRGEVQEKRGLSAAK